MELILPGHPLWSVFYGQLIDWINCVPTKWPDDGKGYDGLVFQHSEAIMRDILKINPAIISKTLDAFEQFHGWCDFEIKNVNNLFIQNSIRWSLCDKPRRELITFDKFSERKIIVSDIMGLGDSVALTGCIRDLKRCHPGVSFDVRSIYPAVWKGNPFLTPLDENDSSVEVYMQGDRFRRFKSGFFHFASQKTFKTPADFLKSHYAKQLHFTLQEKTKLYLPHKPDLTPDLYVTDEELQDVSDKFNLPQGFWIVNSGVAKRLDKDCKRWGHDRYQAVVSALAGRVAFVQVGAATDSVRPLDGVYNLLGKTSLRELFCLYKLAAGSLSGPGHHQHVCAAFGTPCVAILGGMEHPELMTYPNERILHSIGKLDCCQKRGCMRYKRSLCKNFGSESPACMAMIEPAAVIREIQKIENIALSGAGA